jgi:hypothetical protein
MSDPSSLSQSSDLKHLKGEFIPYYQAETNKPYADVLAELEIAISEQNFRITGINSPFRCLCTADENQASTEQ